MVEFLLAVGGTFLLMWIWVGGYVADFVIWIVSKLTPSTANEGVLAGVIGGAFLILGLVQTATIHDSKAAPVVGGAIVGLGLYIAVRVPGKIRRNRAARDLAARAQQPSTTPPIAPQPYAVAPAADPASPPPPTPLPETGYPAAPPHAVPAPAASTEPTA